ncbi:MAG: hypothetical protein R3E87_13400 [Burkholderiaceae bacterium]
MLLAFAACASCSIDFRFSRRLSSAGLFSIARRTASSMGGNGPGAKRSTWNPQGHCADEPAIGDHRRLQRTTGLDHIGARADRPGLDSFGVGLTGATGLDPLSDVAPQHLERLLMLRGEISAQLEAQQIQMRGHVPPGASPVHGCVGDG